MANGFQFSSFCIRILRSEFPWPINAPPLRSPAAPRIIESPRERHAAPPQKIGTQNANAESRKRGAPWPTVSGFLHSAFAFCVLNFRGPSTRLPFDRRQILARQLRRLRPVLPILELLHVEVEIVAVVRGQLVRL